MANDELMIPCDCCRPNGMRRRMGTNEFYLCNYCNGTKMRKAPPGWDPDRHSKEQPEEAKPVSNGTMSYRVYADGDVVFEDEFAERDNALPYYDDYGEYQLPIELVEYIQESA